MAELLFRTPNRTNKRLKDLDPNMSFRSRLQLDNKSFSHSLKRHQPPSILEELSLHPPLLQRSLTLAHKSLYTHSFSWTRMNLSAYRSDDFSTIHGARFSWKYTLVVLGVAKSTYQFKCTLVDE